MEDGLSTHQEPEGVAENNVRKSSAVSEEQQLKFIINGGIVKECELSEAFWAELTVDKWKLVLRMPTFEETLSGYLREGDEDVTQGIKVNVYGKGGREFEMTLKKWVKYRTSFFVLNRGWFTFCDQHGLKVNDLVAIRIFRHGITNKMVGA
ncbi:unnamed protein product [Sphenostylis stenocarpa]|uniref:TF-B3 domain-containing protein n=1 Tax=Sphenostylis stenocarpa TaxID=92480 RepID=A0AA86VK14_9FABA|nr:unnamed protein product [Sphenostylis stenocarpa]